MGRRHYRLLAFTEQGVAILSSALHSVQAVQVNIAIMRAFVTLREILALHREPAQRLDEMESRYDSQFKVVFDAIRELLTTPEKPARRRASRLRERRGFDGAEKAKQPEKDSCRMLRKNCGLPCIPALNEAVKAWAE